LAARLRLFAFAVFLFGVGIDQDSFQACWLSLSACL